jgi:LPXTG-motif cell wall-anchored protein
MFFASSRKLVIATLCLAIIAVIVPNANAQRFDRGTKITINQPFEIPGVALPAGTYVLRLMDIPGSRTVVQLLNADETKSYAIVLGIPDYMLKTPEKTDISFYEAEAGAPLPLRAWFYPGYNYGVEFVYPKKKAVEIARISGEHVIATARPETAIEPTIAELEKEPLIAIEPTGKEAEVAAVHPEPAPPPVTEVRPAPPEPVVKELPKTATPLPLVALAGLLAAGAAGVLRVARKRNG